DWSSDVCSSDLELVAEHVLLDPVAVVHVEDLGPPLYGTSCIGHRVQVFALGVAGMVYAEGRPQPQAGEKDVFPIDRSQESSCFHADLGLIHRGQGMVDGGDAVIGPVLLEYRHVGGVKVRSGKGARNVVVV